MNSVRKLYIKNKTILPVARCYGLVLFLENKFDQSFALFNRIIENYPDDLYTKLYLVMIRPYSSGATHLLLEKALNDYPGNVLARYLQVKMLLAQGKRREGIDRLKKLLRNHPDNVWLNYVLVRNTDADNSIQQKRVQLTYSHILEEIPSFTGARFNLSLFLFKRKLYDKSLEHLDIILARYPDDTASYILKGLIYKIQNKYLSAKKQFEVALILEPGNFKALYNLGALCASKLNDTICARQAFIQYLHVAPQNDRNAAVRTWLHDN
jgi:tetratricopeptide (TPR) repeat protein